VPVSALLQESYSEMKNRLAEKTNLAFAGQPAQKTWPMMHQESAKRPNFRFSLWKMILDEIAAAPAHLQLAQPKATPQVDT
jgi:hypothetical protein